MNEVIRVEDLHKTYKMGDVDVLALRGVKYRPMGAAVLLRNNLLIYGVGGIIIPFIGIKGIDMLITRVGLA